MSTPSQLLLQGIRRGDEAAAAALFETYVVRLLALARKNLSPRLARRMDPEDVVQSALRSFFAHARNGDYVLARAGDLWRLLAAITVHRVQKQAERQNAGKRDLRRDEPAEFLELIAREPAPEDAVIAADSLAEFTRSRSPLERGLLELRLQGMTTEEIADRVERSQRTVRRTLAELHAALEAFLAAEERL